MLLGIDHLVVAVRDPDAAAVAVERELGLAVTGGGRHEAWGTFNRLAFLGDTYLELIGVFDRSLAEAAERDSVVGAALALLDAGAEGLATYALATDDLGAEVTRLRAAGSGIGEPVDGSRIRADGRVVRWRTALASVGPQEPPFLIEHPTDAAEWDADARADRAVFAHPLGGPVRLTRLELPVDDPATTGGRYAATLGVAFEPDADGSRLAMVGAQSIRLGAGGADGAPVVDLAAPGATRPLDAVLFGIRWRCAR
jgi:glyoxalase-like protein